MSRIVPQLPNNALTPDSINVVSTTGFSEGDLVYFNATNGNYGPIPNAAFATVPFNVTQQSALYPGAAFNSFFSVHNPTAIGTYSTGRGSNNSENSTAVLTNGNIVSVWCNRNTNRAWYQIKTAAGATVVAATETTAAFIVNANAGPYIQVAALSGGGFVISFSTTAATSSFLAYGVYDNAGVIVTAWQTDGNLGTLTSGSAAFITALPNGKFVLARTTNTAAVNYRMYDANGTPTYAAVTAPVTTNSVAGSVAIAARSDSSFLLLYPAVDANSLQYILVSATNTVIATASFTAGSNRSNFCDVTCLTNDTFVFAYQYNTGLQTAFIRLLPVGNILGSQIALSPAANQLLPYSNGDTAFTINVKNLASGGFICAWVTVPGIIYYNFYNNLGVLVSGNTSSNYARTIPATGIQSYNCINLIESGGNVIVSFSTYAAGTGSWLLFARINSSTYNLVVPNFITSVLGSAFVAAGNYIPSASTPTQASFYAAASTSADVVVPLSGPSSYVLNPTVISSTNVNSIDSATLINGSFVILTKDTSSPYNVTVRVYSPTGGNTQTIAVGAGISAQYSAKVAAMSDGGFVVSFATGNAGSGNSIVTSNVYVNSGTSFALASSSSFNTAWEFDAGYTLDVCGISNNRFVVAYPRTSQYFPGYKVFSNDGSTLFTATSPNNANWLNTSITGSSLQSSEFAISGFYQAAGVFYTSAFYESSANTWSGSSNTSLSGSTALQNANSMSLPNGSYVTTGTTNTTGYLNVVNSEGSLVAYSGSLVFSTSNTGGFTVGCSGFGTLIAFTDRNSAVGGQPTIYVFNPNCWDYQASITGSSYTINSGTGMTFTSSPSLRITPGVGYQAVLSWINSSNFACYAIINAYPYSVNTTVTSGVSISSGVPLSAQNGFVLAGVAAQTVSAGASGNVTTNGSAVLNANYSATTAAQAFDFQNPALFGVKGTIVGRNVNLQGNN